MRRFLATHFEAGGRAGRLRPMEGMRGFAALIVFFVHFHALFDRYLIPSSPLHPVSLFAASFGHVGVDIFFVLSGFLIYGILLGRKPGFGPFLWRRVQRLYPAFLVVFAIYFVLLTAFPGYVDKMPAAPAERSWYVIANLLMLPGVINMRPMISVAWSLSYELFFYTFIAGVVTALSLRRWQPRFRLCFFAVLAVIYMSVSLADPRLWPRMIMFLAGIILWEMTNGLRVWRNPLPALEIPICILFLATLVSIGLAGTGQEISEMRAVTFATFRLPLLFVSALGLSLYALFGSGILSALFSWDYLRWFGNMSYSFYLIHGLSLHGLRVVLTPVLKEHQMADVVYIALFVTGMIAAAGASGVLFLMIEKRWSLAPQFRTPAVEEVCETTAGAIQVQSTAQY